MASKLLCFLLLVLGGLGALAQNINELEFTLEGTRYTETVVDGDDFQVVVVPRQGVADHTMVMHDFEMRLTAFKDLTTRRCIILPLNHLVSRLRGVIFKDRLSPSEALPSNRNIMLEVDGDKMDDVILETGEKIGELCQGFPTFWASISKKDSTFNMSGRRFRRWSFSGSASVSTDGKSGSASGSVSGGSNGAESNAGSNNGNNGGGSQTGGKAN